MTLPDLKSTAQLDTAPWSKGVDTVLKDLRAIQDLSKKVGTFKLTTDLSAGRDAQRVTAGVRAALENMVPTDMQRRIDGMFGSMTSSAAASARVFEQQGSRTALLKRQLDDLSNAIKLTRAEFQNGVGDASPEELARLSSEMGRLKGQMDALKPQIKETFGVWSNEALKAEMATRTAVSTVEGAHGRISRLGLASQVKLGASAALAEFGPLAGGATNGLVQLAQASERARLSSVFFEKQLQKNNVQLSEGRKMVNDLAGAFNVMPNTVEEVYKVLLRNGYTMAQATETMKLYAGSALAAGKDVGTAWDALAQDVMMGTTVMSNAQGITANQATSWQKYANTLGIAVDKLTETQKAEAFLIQLRKEASQELKDADEILKGYAGSQGQLNQELRESQMQLGQNLMPLLANGTRLLLGFVEGFNALPEPARNVALALGVTAVAVLALAVPVNALVASYTALTAAKAASVAATSLETAATTRLNVVTTIHKVLMMDVGVAYAAANKWAMLHNGSMAASVAVNSSVTASLVTLKGAITGVVGAISIYTVAATAALALGLYWADSVKKTTAIYEQMDKANEESFNRTMARVAELRRSGTELGRAQARYLLLTEQLASAQQGDLKGVNMLTGERIYGPPDEARIKKLQADLATTRQNITLLYTEAQRRGTLNLKLTEDQTKAVKKLNEELSGRKFDLKVAGMTDMQRDLAKIGQEFDKLRQEFKKPFVVNGKLLDPAQTPALRDGLSQLDAQLLAEQEATRKRYADEAVKTAREAALSAQRVELEAMRDGQAKTAGLRRLEIDQIKADTAERVKALADFPDQQRSLEESARRTIAAKRRAWAAEDVQLARENAKRVADAEKSARDARISSMTEGLRKEEALRAAAVADLKASIAEQVAALEGDPRAQARVQGAGNAQVSALLAQQARERAAAVKAANDQVLESEKVTRDAVIAGMTDGAAREEALRAAALADLRADVRKRVEALADYPTQQARVQAEGNRQILALEAQHQAARVKAAQEAGKLVSEASRAARDAEISAIRDETQRTRAQREREVQDVRDSVKKRVEALKDYPILQAQVIAEGQRQISALQDKFNQEDEQKAREHALKMAQAWAGVRGAQFDAAQAGRGAGDAQFELQLSRRIAAARENAVEVARIEQEGQRERARRAQASADAQFGEEKRRLLETATLAAEADKVTEGERRAIWARYYADLNKLDSDYQAGNRQRQRDSEEQARQAAEAMRQARIAEANKPVQASQNRVQELGWAADLARSDSEILRINREVSAEREKQIQALRGQLVGLGGVMLTTEERQQVEQQIKQLQQDQAVAVREQADAQRALLQSTLERQRAEADFNERWARSDAELLTARLNSISVYQRQLTQLEGQIAGEGREVERNQLLGQRLALITQIGEKQAEIDAMPGEAEQRRVQGLQAQRAYLLSIAGLSDNQVAQAQERVRVTREEVALAARALQVARTQAEQEAARTELIQKNTALVSAEFDLTRARNQQQTQALDLLEARARAELQLRDLADDAVATAQVDLDVTRQKLALIEQQLGAGGLTSADQLALQRQQVDLVGQQASQERALAQAQRDRAKLLEGLVDAQRDLTVELEGSTRRAAPLQAAFRGVATARAAVARAERDYQDAQQRGKPEQIKTATEALTGAIRAQRDAVAGLAEEYRKQISSMDGVRDIADRLNKIVYGEQGKKYDFNTELRRLQAIEERRNAAQVKLTEALNSGQADQIQKAAAEFATQEERYRKQADLMEKNGSQIARTGEAQARRLADQVDALGIQYDREAVALEERAALADREAQSVMQLDGIVTRWAASNTALAAQLRDIRVNLPAAPAVALGSVPGLAELAAAIRTSTPATAPAPQFTQHNTFYATINAASDRAPDIKRAAREAFQEFVGEAQQKKAWEGKCRK